MFDEKRTKSIDDAQFQTEVLEAPQLQLVDFWAEWCGPCKKLSPAIESLAEEYAGRVGVHKMNVDENSATPARYEIRGIPTVLIFKDGELVDRVVGAVPKDVLKQSIEKYLA